MKSAFQGYQLVTTGIKTSKISTDISVDTNSYENDQLYEKLSDLVNSRFRPWYCKMFYKLGRQNVLAIASIARADGKNPSRLFSKLLKEAYESC